MPHQARKRFGQNFLTDPGVIGRIIDAIRPCPGQQIVEIGPGQAALTGHLAESGAELHLVEIDRDLAARLRDDFSSAENVTVHEGDALTMDFGAITQNRRFRLVGNLPYNISTPLLFHVLSWSESIEDMHFMLQREVVNRMASEPGSKAWGRLSLMCQYRCSVAPLFEVPPGAFSPAPRVESAVVRLVPHASPPVEIPDLQAFDRIVSRVFSQRRKTLRNSLRGMVDPVRMEAAGIDPGARPETLDLAAFARLAALVSANGSR